MSFFVQVTPGVQPKSDNVRIVAIIFAVILVIMVVAQLFTFEDFPALIADYLLPTGTRLAPMLAAIIVSVEVLALPFLLGMAVSPLMRWLSMVCGWVAVAIWIKISLWLVITMNVATNAGILGATIKVPIGWWTVLFSLLLGGLAIWSSRGLWPRVPRAK